jgi:hypothetical protein
MAGPVPAIHVFALARKQDVDARDEPGHDETVTQDDATSFRAGAFAVITNPSYPFAATSLQIWR